MNSEVTRYSKFCIPDKMNCEFRLSACDCTIDDCSHFDVVKPNHKDMKFMTYMLVYLPYDDSCFILFLNVFLIFALWFSLQWYQNQEMAIKHVRCRGHKY
uniref:Uncharacterized protein n=1 Tax=Glossina palpalis gambiensis TaxID=67801 RepID=A0A1B0APZ1_9MUSC